jgi:hypothetical protein
VLDRYTVDLKWSPGADLSGGVVRVGFPEGEAAEVELYMNY